MNKLFLGFIFALLLGCQGGWDKNPRLEGLPPEVEQEPPSYMAAMRDSIFIMSDLEYEFTEGQQDAVVEFDVNVLQEDIADVKVDIPNFGEYLPGATYNYDRSAGKVAIHWSVPEVFVRGVESNQVSYDLQVNVYTTSLNQTVNKREKIVRFTVLRRLERPEIVRVENVNDTGDPRVREGSRGSLRVTVRDPNASNGSIMVAPPILMVEPSGSAGLSGHHLMEVGAPTQDANDPTLWHFPLSIVTTGLEITNNSKLFNYDLRAYTPMGMSDEKLRSTAFSGRFTVYTQIGQVAFTGGHRVNFREGGINSVAVTFFDPRGEGKAVVDMDELKKTCDDKGAICECKPAGDMQQCEIWWTPKASDADPRREVVHTFKFSAFLQHKVTGEKSAAKEFEQAIHVTSSF